MERLDPPRDEPALRIRSFFRALSFSVVRAVFLLRARLTGCRGAQLQQVQAHGRYRRLAGCWCCVNSAV